MTREQKTKISEHFDWLHTTASNVPDDLKDVLKAAYLAGAAYALDIYCPHWISVEDELPPKKSEYDDLSNNVLATDGKEIYESVYNHDSKDWFTHDMWGLDNITHRMPLPSVEHLRETTKMIEKGGER